MGIEKKFTTEEVLQRLMRICSTKEVCSYDIRRKMIFLGTDESDQEKIIKYLKKENFFSDERYSRAFANDRLKFQKWGKIKIRRALLAKRIPQAIIDEVLKDTESVNYSGNLIEILNKKLHSLKGTVSVQEKKAKLYRLAISRGFESEMILDVLDKIVNE